MCSTTDRTDGTSTGVDLAVLVEHFHELAAEPGDHPCLRATPKRTLDEATAEQLGDYLILEWRGKRHEILYRP